MFILQLGSVLVIVASIMFFRVSITLAVYALTNDTGNEIFISQSKLIVSMLAAGINLLAIVILNMIYSRIALWMTNMEHPRTQTEFEDNYTFKI